MRKLILAVAIVISSLYAHAQIAIEAGAMLGASVYQGDVDVTFENFLQQTRPVGGVFARYYVLPSIAVRGQMYFTKLYGDEKKYGTSSYRRSRGFSFNTSLTEVGFQAEWHLIRLDRNLRFEKNEPFITLYGFGGATGVLFNAKTDFNEPNPTKEDVTIDKNANYNNWTVSLLGGGGIKMMINNETSIGFESSVRRSNSDYLDGISKLGSPRVNDFYFFNTVTFTRTFGGDLGLVGKGKHYRRKVRRGALGCPGF